MQQNYRLEGQQCLFWSGLFRENDHFLEESAIFLKESAIFTTLL